MDDISHIYEKLVDMGFNHEAIDEAIKKGFYTFDKIFTELVNTDRSLRTFVSVNESNIMYSSSPLSLLPGSRLRSTESGIFDAYQIYSESATGPSDLHRPHPDQVSSFSHVTMEDNSAFLNVDNSLSMGSTLRIDRLNLSKDISGHEFALDSYDPLKTATSTKPCKSYSITTPSLLSNNVVETKINRETRVQILDLLDPVYEPITYSHLFMFNICTIRDLLCWFHKCRYSTVSKKLVKNLDMGQNRLAIPGETDLPILIELFQNLKWHLVLPSDTKPARVYGNEFLDKTLEYLGVQPSFYFLAVVSCPTEQMKQVDMLTVKVPVSLSIRNANQSCSALESTIVSVSCSVKIRMINFRANPFHLQGRVAYTHNYDPVLTTLQRVAVDFANFCQMTIGSFSLLQMHPKRTFCYPDDFLRSLSDLGLVTDVTLFCHCLTSLRSPALNENSSNLVGNSHLSLELDYHLDESNLFEAIDDNHPSSRFSSSSCPDNSLLKSCQSPKTLFRLCIEGIHLSLHWRHSLLCRSVKTLPNNLQQLILKRFVDDQSLTADVLGFFCAPDSCLLVLDLSYTSLVTNDVLRCIGKCTCLQELVLDNDEHVFSNEGLWHLRQCLCLKRLSLNYCSKINDWGIQVIGFLADLSVLAIKYTAVTSVGWKHIYLHLCSRDDDIVTCPPLRSLDLSGLAISDECLAWLSIFSRLDLLNLSSTHISNPSLFPHLPFLRHLDISNCQELVWEKEVHIRALCEYFPNLTSINVQGVSNSNLVHLTMALAHCKYLRHLVGIFSHPQMTASLAASLSHLPLETIMLTNCQHVTDLWLPVLARFSSTLTHLVLSSCDFITGENNALVNNLSRLRNLSWLDLTHLGNVDNAQIIKLVIGGYFSKLQVLWLSLTDKEELMFMDLAPNIDFKVNIIRSINRIDELELY